MPKSFRDLKVWQLAIDVSLMVYDLTDSFPRHELFGLTSQMRRAGVSVASNIAEGSARSTSKDFKQFVLIAKGSVCELQTQIVIAYRRGYVDAAAYSEAEKQLEKVAQMLSGLAKHLDTAKPRRLS